MADYHFGIEIEVRVEPHKIRPPLSEKHALYYGKLAAALRKRGLEAKADDLAGKYRKHPEHYDKWYVTKDGSLGNPQNLIPMEVVSPVLSCRQDWEEEIDVFWLAMRAVFHMPERSPLCGSHIHISRSLGKRFTLSQLKSIAYGIVIYEPLIVSLLMSNRVNNKYCKVNTVNSSRLRQCGSNTRAVAKLIKSATDTEMLKDIMQDSRYVLWNFDNIVPGRSGTIEFRGGRCLRGEVRTKRWIAFTIAMVHAFLTMDDISHPDRISISTWSPEGFYETVKKSTRQLCMRDLLPKDFEVLNETKRED
ncbi:putative amidoligase enzyme-domain-containing protein [Xylaria bambusicola]|uniref:putative amidoligase enzyme-domain-containing protein n=1 Tax=Xylaria bambusicola TaxID=326684 RepID=UPI0020072DF9|nr:putative amidoligase enzyme-domain-containing protein [Xylaria bambusicola]KAI0506349.1 putative amidoligase enzyme-domain-containing protein [Xylaria bambusicola]